MANFHVLTPGNAASDTIEVRKIGLSDVFDALRKGFEDFMERPSHYVFLVILYPIIGLTLFAWAARGDALQLIYPLVTGFALLGPIAAIGLYEISRRRERNEDTSWTHALEVVRSPAIPSIAVVGLALLVLFFVWLYVAESIYEMTFGGAAYDSLGAFFTDVTTTSRGLTLIIVGNLVGFIFAVITLCLSVVTFPLLLDRDVGAVAAVGTSIRAVQKNPVPLLAWGLIIAVLLFVGALPALAGLIIVLPVLGHATWHIYRKVVADGVRPAPQR